MIRSRFANVMLIAFGVLIALYLLVAWALTIKEGGIRSTLDLYQGVVSVILSGLSVWCIRGGWQNLARPTLDKREVSDPLFGPAKVNLYAVTGCGLAAFVLYATAPRSITFWIFYEAFLVLLLVTPWLVVIGYLVSRRRSIQNTKNPEV